MKSLRKLTIAVTAAVLLLLSFTEVKAADPWHHHHHNRGRWASYGPSYNAYAPATVSLQVFYDELAPYGTWINDPYYGYVWAPAVDAGFRPYYTNGYWAYTDYGNTWVSYYDWGWAPFHYGRWTYDAYYGWIWVPDTVWGPAWVGWRSSANFYGWAPLAPGWGVSFSSYSFPMDWWVFCPPTYVYDRHFYWHCNEPRYNNTIINNTTIVNNTYVVNNVTYVQGPSSTDYEHSTGQKPQMYQLRELDHAGATKVENNFVNVYRPQVSKPATDKQQVAPANPVKAERNIGKPEPMSVNNGQPQFKSDARQLELNKNLQPADRNIGTTKPGVTDAKPAQGETQKQNLNDGRNQAQPQRMDINKEQNVTPQQQGQKQQLQPSQAPQQQPQQRGWQQQPQQQPRQMEQQRQEPKQQFEQPKQQPRQQFEQPKQAPEQQPQQRGWQQQPQQQPRQMEQQRQEPKQQFEQQRQEPKQQFEQPRQAPSRGEPQMQPRQQFEQPRQQFEQPRQQFEQPRQEPMQQQRQFQPQQQPQQRQMQQPQQQAPGLNRRGPR